MKDVRSMKHFLTFFLALALLLSLAGCGTAKAKTVISQDTLLCYPGLRWNMTPEEVLAALGRRESDTVPEACLADFDSTKHRDFSLTGLELFGQTVSAVFSFVAEGEGQWGLEYVYVLFPENGDFAGVKNSLAEQLGDPVMPPNQSQDGHALQWDSTQTLEPYLDAAFPARTNTSADEIPAARVFWTDDAQRYFKCFGLSESGWRESHTEENLLVFAGYLTHLLQSAPAAPD